jgi:cysteine desulfurase/selenocysteine lyase
VRRDFPILRERVNGRPLIWLDNAATTQKPQAVIDRLKTFYEPRELQHPPRRARAGGARDRRLRGRARDRAPLHRRELAEEIVFVRGTTEAINLVAKSWGGSNVNGRGDEIVVSHLEHHANIVPWQQLAARRARAARDPGRRQGQVLLDEYQKLLNDARRSSR